MSFLKRQSIRVELADQEAGTKAFVTTAGLFRRRVEEVYVCFRTGIWAGGEWRNVRTNEVVFDIDLFTALNHAAQAAAAGRQRVCRQ